MSQGTIHYSKAGDRVGLLEIDNPPANALGTFMRALLRERLAEIDKADDVRALVLTGRGRAFCSGDDLGEQLAAQQKPDTERTAHLVDFADLLDGLERFRLPVIAAINGWSVGGGLELALASDIRVASAEAKFVCAGVNVGLMASAWRLPRLIGIARAKHMLLTGSPFDAQTAERFGLVAAVHAPAELMRETLILAERIASRAPLSLEAVKRTVAATHGLSADEAAKAAAHELERLGRSADHTEALLAFREKREPRFIRG